MPTPQENLTQEKPELIPEVWTSKEVLDRAYSFIREQLEKSLPDHYSRRTKWLLWDNIYRLIDKDKPTDGGCQVVDPEPHTEVEVMKANYMEAFFGQDQTFEYKGTEDTDEEQARIITAYRQDHLRRIGLREKFERTIHQLCVNGTAVCKDPWRKEYSERVIKERVAVRDKDGRQIVDRNGKKKFKTVTEKKLFPTWDDTDWEYVSLFDFIPVGSGSDVQDLTGVIHRVKTNWDSIKKNERKTENVAGQKITSGVYYNLDAVSPISSSDMDLCEYWGKIPKWVITGKEEDRYICFEGMLAGIIDIDTTWENMVSGSHSESTGELAGDMHDKASIGEAIIRLQENPFWHGERPFRVCQHTPVDNELYGIGIIEPNVDKWMELNTTIRQIVDNKTLQLLNPTIEDSHANVQRDVKLIKFPRIKADDVNAVVPLPINDFSANGWKVVQALKDDMRKTSGAVETIQGVPLGGDRTSATEFQGTFQQAGVRIKNRIRLIDEKLFKKFLDRAYQNDQQFAEYDRIVRVVGEKGVAFKRVRPEDIWGTFDVITYGPTAFENKVVKTNKLVNFMGMAAKAPQFVNIPSLFRQIYLKMELGTESEADEIVISQESNDPEEINNENTTLAIGQPVKVSRKDNHQIHIMEHMKSSSELSNQGLMTDSAFKAFEDHVNEHLSLMQKATEMKAIQGQVENGGMGGQGGMGSLAQNGQEAPAPDVSQQQTMNPMQELPR